MTRSARVFVRISNCEITARDWMKDAIRIQATRTAGRARPEPTRSQKRFGRPTRCHPSLWATYTHGRAQNALPAFVSLSGGTWVRVLAGVRVLPYIHADLLRCRVWLDQPSPEYCFVSYDLIEAGHSEFRTPFLPGIHVVDRPKRGKALLFNALFR